MPCSGDLTARNFDFWRRVHGAGGVEDGGGSNGLSFESSAFSDPQGAGTAAAIEWRIGEFSSILGEPRVYEIEENWTSPQDPTFDLSIVPPASAVTAGNTYRARVRHQDTTGRWSHWSAPIEFVASAPDASDLQQNLVISEIMYNPATSQEHEYIELHNIGTTALDLTDVRFIDGIDFDFPSGTMVAPGEYVLVVRDEVAFAAHHGAGLPVVGSYGTNDSGSLSNGGEGITLALGTTSIHQFEYNDRSPWPENPDGGGSALVLYHTTATQDPVDPLGHGIAGNWRQGVSGGTPGTADPSGPFTGDPDADEDNDGLNAFLDHALGTSDSRPGSAGLVVEFDGERMSLTFPRNPLASDVRHIVEVSPDLTEWTEQAALDSQEATSATYVFESTNTEEPRYFMRLRVEQTTIIQQ